MFTVYRCFTFLKYEKDCLITVTRPHKAEQTSHFLFSDVKTVSMWCCLKIMKKCIKF